MQKANERQEGGSHYRKHTAEFQHWDWVISVNMPYVLGCSSKYLTRWRDKGKPLEDLRKARHYLEKCIENATIIMAYRGGDMPLSRDWVIGETNRFVAANNVPTVEAEICMAFATWTSRHELALAREKITKLIEAYHNDESAHLPKNTAADIDKFQSEVSAR